jgi:transcriptional regulator with XRE-family HTH domain
MNTHSPECVRFGSHIRELRSQKGFSQESFADQCGIHRTYIGGLERGERNPTLVTILRISSALGISPAKLFESMEMHEQA